MTTKGRRKAKGFGHTYKVGNSWRTVIRHESHVISANASTQQESKRRAREKYLSLQSRHDLKLAAGSRLTLGEFITHWLDHEHKSAIAPSTFARYQGLTKHHILPILGEMQVRLITRHDISRLLSMMAQNRQSPRSQQQARAILSIALRAAVESGRLSSNPVTGVRNILVQKQSITPLTGDEVRALLSHHEGTFMSARLHIAVLCGLRQGEALGLRWSDLNLDKAILSVKTQIQKVEGKRVFVGLKTESSRRNIVLARETVRVLREHRVIVESMRGNAKEDWEENDLVFPNHHGAPIQSKWDYQKWIYALRDVGIDKRSLHSARHTAATLLYENGVGIETIRRVLGHSTIALTSRTYVHNAEQPLRLAAATLDEFLLTRKIWAVSA